MNEHIRISRDKAASGFRWSERALGALLAVLIMLISLAFGALLLGVLAAGVLLLAVRVWWWRRRLRHAASQNAMVIEGEYRVLDSRRAGNKQD
jgi:Flp pilus assembly protein TadB